MHWKQGLIFLSVGLELVILTIGGAAGGYYLDEAWGTRPWMMVAGLLLGAAAGFVHFFRLARKFV